MTSDRIRVCHLSKYYPPAPGGIETHVRTLALAQAALGAEVAVYCVNHGPGPTVVERDGPVEVTRFGRAAAAAKIDVCPGLSRALARAGADVLHMQVPNPTMVLALLASRPRAPLVVTYQSDVIRQRLRALAFRPVERLVYRRVKLILSSSPGYPGGSAFLRPYRDRLDVLPNGIDLAPYLDPSPGHRAEAGRIRARHAGPLWLGCGRMVYYKGFLNAIRALTRVRGTLLLVGGGPDRPALEAEAKRLGVDGRVVFLGNLPHYLDLVPYYLAADAFWFPSNARSEAFGLVQVEAMAAGCPVINAAIPHSGVPWVSRHEEEGLTVPVDDPIALADAANRLLDEPGLRDRLAAAARRRAAAEFDHRAMAERSLALYRRVLDGRWAAGGGQWAGNGEDSPSDRGWLAEGAALVRDESRAASPEAGCL
jgi:glycosyltransferase involved in cell wall biosynthesis